jgi:biotin synthase
MSDPLPGVAPDTIACALSGAPLTRAQIISLLALPEGEAGERRFQTADTIRRQEVGDAALREARAERYLLKHETSAAGLYGRLRPGSSLTDRLRCRATLADLGYEVGAGNMVGLPNHTLEMLADDLLLMQELAADMLGIDPFLPQPETPLADSPAGDLYLTLKVLAVARLLTRRTHIPATTTLGILDGRGRIKALQAGANVVMPDFTPPSFRQHYGIYPGRSDPQNVHDFLCRLGRRSAAAANHRTGKRWKNQA